MIIDKEVHIVLNSANMYHYFNRNYTGKCNEKILVNVEDLTSGSHVIVNVKCDICGKEKKLMYKSYTICLKHNMYCCNKCKNEKSKITCLEKYGVDNVSKTKEILDKIKKVKLEKYGDETYNNLEKCKKTWLEKYGVENVSYNKETLEKRRITKLKNKTQLSDEQLSNLKLYKKLVDKETRKNKKMLFKDWNGYDYYDKEFIKENYNLEICDKNYPTIDHKISVFHGFNNNILPIIIGTIDNLCITKRGINSGKREKTETEYYDYRKI